MMRKSVGDGRKRVRMIGGSARSDLWNQVVSDVLGVKLFTTKTVETSALGAAICAAAGAGIYSNIEEAVNYMVQVKKEYQPNPDFGSFMTDSITRYTASSMTGSMT